MNRKKPKKSTTPKKSSKKSSATQRKKSNSTPNNLPKSTPIKTRRSRTLPKSPISESMKQSKINDFFKPSIKTEICSQSPQPNVTEVESNKTIQRKALKGPKTLQPVFGQQKRYSLRNSNNSVKKLKFETDGEQNQSSDEHNCEVIEVMEVSDNSPKPVADPPKVSKANKNKSRAVQVEGYGGHQNLDQMMTELKINEKQKSSTNVLRTSAENELLDNQMPDMSDSNVIKICEKIANHLEEDMDLIPVFKKPELPKQKKKSLKENTNKYVDKEKEKKMNYFLKNLSRIKKDKEMLNIQSIEDTISEMDIELTESKSEETVLKSYFRIKPFEGIDIFCDYIPETIENYLSEEMDANSSVELKVFKELPINRLLRLLPVVSKRLKEPERQQLVSHIIHLISTEECPINCNQSEYKIIDLLTENDFEIYLSVILKDFYRILSRITNNLRNAIDSHPNDNQILNELKFLSNVIRLMSQILSKSSFKIEAIDSVEEFTKLLITSFALGLDYRLIKNGDQIIDIKNFIEVILNNIYVDELKAVPIIENLISFCASEERKDKLLSLQIVSLFPLNIDFELKRKFCISVILLFVTSNTNEFEMNLSGIPDILVDIDWKSLSSENIYVIIQMIGLSLDLPKDLIDHKETIASILGVLENKINISVPKAKEFAFSEIHKLLMILRTKVNVSTKRF